MEKTRGGLAGASERKPDLVLAIGLGGDVLDLVGLLQGGDPAEVDRPAGDRVRPPGTGQRRADLLDPAVIPGLGAHGHRVPLPGLDQPPPQACARSTVASIRNQTASSKCVKWGAESCSRRQWASTKQQTDVANVSAARCLTNPCPVAA